jgi:hypothetical protein
VLVATLILGTGLISVPLDVRGADLSADLIVPSGPLDGPLTFDIPLRPWLADIVVGLKTDFVEGVAAEAMRVATEESSAEAMSVVDAASDLSAVANRIAGSMEILGEMDPTCGMPGLSPLMPMQGAVRETLFGRIVWHESVTGKSRPMTGDLDRVVRELSEMGNRSLRLGRDIDMGMGCLEGGGDNYSTLAESATRLTAAMSGLRLEAAAAETAGVELEQLVWEIRDGAAVKNQARLDVEWEKVQMATSEIRRLAARIGPAVEALSSSNRTFIGLTRSVEEMSEQLDTFAALPADADGARHVPKDLIGASIGTIEALEAEVLEAAGEAFPDESLSKIKALIRGVVEAERMLAERAVEYASTSVAGANDRFETKYRADAGYDSKAGEKQQEKALDGVAAKFRSNADLQSAHVSARACRAWLAEGLRKQAGGYGLEADALSAYRYAWEHALIAGASADRALAKAKSN